MGAYLSKPVTEKEIESAENDFLAFSSGSMQGWRTSQEDAHNCILNFNDDYSLFAVYDGHGGAEVAQLCSQKLPDHIKNSSDFINGNFSEALTNSFLSFDDEILKEEMQETLKKLANISDMESENDDEDDTSLLQEEAMTPLSEILKKYQIPFQSVSNEEIDNQVDEKVEDEVTKEMISTSQLVDKINNIKKVQEDSDTSESDDDESYMYDDNNGDIDSDDENDDEDEDVNEIVNEDKDDDKVEFDDEDDEDEVCSENEGNDKSPFEEVRTDPHFPPFQYLQSAPGYDSGSTAILSLINRKTLKMHVANVGDSRCVLCRNGEAVDLSIDHKPEDEIESQRITKAGGILSEDGRVNGGLNLSRSLGDHSYKKNKDIPMKEQMISAFPDIQTIDLKPLEDEFLVLACDGIWNTFTSQQLIDFIKKRITIMPITELISEIFTHCLAPNTSGDGTGCDNMTCIIVTFKFQSPNTTVCNGKSNKKRAANKDIEDESFDNNDKRMKLQNEESVKI